MTKIALPPRRYAKPARRFSEGGDADDPASPVDRRPAKTDVVKPRLAQKPDGAGTIVLGVRVTPQFLARLDKARGGLTRPQKVREILTAALLEKELPE